MVLVAERAHPLSRAAEGFDLADVTFLLGDKQGCVLVKTNVYSVPIQAGTRVEARVIRCMSVSGAAAIDLPGTSAATAAGSMCWTWSITSTRCATSRVLWPARNRWRSGARQVAYPPATTRSGLGCWPGTASRTAPVPWLQWWRWERIRP